MASLPSSRRVRRTPSILVIGFLLGCDAAAAPFFLSAMSASRSGVGAGDVILIVAPDSPNLLQTARKKEPSRPGLTPQILPGRLNLSRQTPGAEKDRNGDGTHPCVGRKRSKWC